jgi:plastocyanin
VGDRVTWTNDNLYPHSFTLGQSGHPVGKFYSSITATGTTFENIYLQKQASTLIYFCPLHLNMVGGISVS